MADNVQFQSATLATAPAVTLVEATQQADSSARQIVSVAPRGVNTQDAIGSLTETAPATDTASSAVNGRLQRVAQRLTSLIALLPTALGAGGGLKIDGSGTALPVSGTVTATPPRPATGTQSNVASSATDVTILASNANRQGGMIFNDSTQVLYLLLASGTSTTSLYTVQVPNAASFGYYEIPFGYIGVIKGFWTTANGNARVTEITA